MPAIRRLQLDELLNRPGTYLNPQTEVLLVVDDSSHLDTELLDEEFDSDDWVVVSDEVPIDEHERDALLERFHIQHEDTEEPDEDENEELEPDEDPDDE